jgi:hypothetical protein
LAFDKDGNLYVANLLGGSVSKFAPGHTTATGTLTGVVFPRGLVFDASGNLLVSNENTNKISKFAPGDTTPSATLTGVQSPGFMLFDASGNLYVGNTQGNTTVSKFAPGGTTPSATLTGVNGPFDMAFDASGNLYVTNFNGTTVSKFTSGAITPSATLTGLNGPVALAFDASGDLYVANLNGTTVSKFAPLSTVTSQVTIRSSLPTRPMSIGGTNNAAVAGINLTSAELARIFTGPNGKVRIGDHSQTGNITITDATVANTSGAATVVVQSTSGGGKIILDDGAGGGTALTGNGGRVHLTAGTGGIVAANSAANPFEISTTAGVNLHTGGTAGTAANPLHVHAATLAVDATGGLTLTTQVSKLAADSGNGGVTVRNTGDLTLAALPSLTGVTAAGAINIRTTGALSVNADVTSSSSGNDVFQAGGDLTVDPAATINAGKGTLTLNAGFDSNSSGNYLTANTGSLDARSAFLNGGIGAGVTFRLVPNGSTPISLVGGNPGFLEIDDQADGAARTFTVKATKISWDGETLSYTELGGITINAGSGGNNFDVQSTDATAAVTIVGGGEDTLAGSDAGNLFALAGKNAGTLSGNDYESDVAFSGIGNLTAGNGGDTFQFADGATLTGNIVGGGSDTLDYSAYTTSVVVDLQTGDATGVGGSVSGIGTVLGGSGTPAASGTYNLLIGSGGNTLTGGTGRRNILVGGGSPSTLIGGDAASEDILIGGFTDYDTEAGLARWQQIAVFWAGPGSRNTRVRALLDGTGVPALDVDTVHSNGGGNVFQGNGDWGLLFYLRGADTITGFDVTSQLVAIKRNHQNQQ